MRFTVIVTPRYERLFKKLLRGHRDLLALQGRVGEILAADPRRSTLKRAPPGTSLTGH